MTGCATIEEARATEALSIDHHLAKEVTGEKGDTYATRVHLSKWGWVALVIGLLVLVWIVFAFPGSGSGSRGVAYARLRWASEQ